MKSIFTAALLLLLSAEVLFAQKFLAPTPEKLAQPAFVVPPQHESPAISPDLQPCNTPTTITCGQLLTNQSTVGGTSNFNTSSYANCATGFGANDFFAPDRLYKFTLAAQSEVNLSVEILTSGADFDIFILSSCSPALCIGGSAGATGYEMVQVILPAGDHYLVVDGYNGAQGNFNIQLSCSCNCVEDDFIGDMIACENFEDYNTNDSLAAKSARWRKWASGEADGVIKTDVSDNYLRCEKLATQETDVLMNFGAWGAERFRLSFKMLVEPGKIGNYYVMHQFPGTTGLNPNIAYQVLFNPDGNGFVRLAGGSTNVASFEYANGTWTDIVQIIDLDLDRVDLWIGGQFVHTWTFSQGSLGTQKRLEGLNFDAHFNNYNYRVDNICLRTRIDPCFVTTEYNPVCIENGTTEDNNSIATCELYTPDEIALCTKVCDYAGNFIYRGDNFSGAFTASDQAPPSLRNWPQVQAAYGNNVPPNLYADIYVFSKQDADIIGINFQNNGNASVKGFVFVCSYEPFNPTAKPEDTGAENLACVDGEAWWATLTPNVTTTVAVNNCQNFYYIVITGVLGATYSNLNIIPNGDCDANPPVLTCGQTLSDVITGAPNGKFIATAPAYVSCYNGTRTYAGGENFYKFTLTQPSDVTINLTATGATPAPMGVFLYSFLCGENCLGYAENTAFNASAALKAQLSAGTYYLVVDKALNSGSTGFNINVNCTPYSPTITENAFIFANYDCPTDHVAPAHLVKLNYSPTYDSSDYFRFYYRDTNGSPNSNDEAGQYWHNSDQPLDFNIFGDDLTVAGKCSYTAGDTFLLYIFGQNNSKEYKISYSPALGGGVTDELEFRPGGYSRITKLTEVDVVNFSAETSFLRTGPAAITLPLRFITNQDWNLAVVPTPVPWLTVDPTSGSSGKILSLGFQANTSVIPRTAYLEFYSAAAPDVYHQFVKVEQQGLCNIPQAVNIVAGGSTSICAGTSISLLADAGTQYQDIYNYLWSTGETGSSITVTPNSTATYSVTITNKYCFITSVDAQTITVTQHPAAPTPAVNATICPGQANLQSVSVGAQAPGVQVFWYTASSGGTALNATSSLTYTPNPAPAVTTTYYAQSLQNGCASLDRTPVVLTVATAPNFVTTDTICNANLLTYRIVVTLSNGTTITTTPTFPVTFSNGVYTIDNIPKGTNVTLNASNATCSKTKLVTSPVCSCTFVQAPQSGGNKQYCIGGTPPLLTVATNNGTVVEWYSQMNGGILLGSGEMFQSSGPGTYWAQARNTQNMCISARTGVVVTLNALPTFNLLEKTCSNDLTSYKIRFSTDGDLATAAPYSVAILGGGIFEITGITPGQAVTIHIVDNGTGCTSDMLIDSPQCGCPFIAKPTTNTPLVNPCEGATVPPLTVSVGATLLANWYRNGQLQPGSPTLSLSASVAGDYWAKTYNPQNQCESADSTKVTLQFKPLPTLSVVSKVCDGPWQNYQVTVSSNSVGLSSTPNIVPSNNGNGTFTFAGIPIATTIVITATTSGCSTSITVEPPVCSCVAVPLAPSNPNNPTICLGDDIPFLTVSVTNASTETVDWYDVPSGGAPLFNPSVIKTQFKPVAASVTTVYYAQAKFIQNGNCISARTAVTLKVDQPATAFAGQNGSICSDETVMLNGVIGGTAGSGAWSAQPLGGAFSPNSSFLTAQQYAPPNNFLNGNITLTLTAFPLQPSVCPSVSDQLILSVKQTPTITLIQQNCEPDLNHYFIQFTTQGDDIEFIPNVGVLSLNPDGSYTYGNIPEGIQLTIIAKLVATNCDYTLSLPAKICDCPTDIAKPNTLGDKEVCIGSSQMPTLEVSVPGGFTVDWYDAPFNGNKIRSNDATFENPPGPDDYWAEAKNVLNSCTSMVRTLVKLTAVPGPTADAGFDQFVCSGNTVTLNAVLGGANYVYEWSTGQTGPSVTVPNQTATYYLTVRLGDCISRDTVQVTALPGVVASISQTHAISCPGTTDGALSASGTGGTQPYTYAWSNSSTGATINNLTAGTYTVIVTNAEGCTATTSSTLTSPNPLVLTGSSIQNTSNNLDNGSIQVTITGGALPYQYQWLLSNNSPIANQTQSQLSGQFAGQYRVRVTDANGCIFLSELFTILNTVSTGEPLADLQVQVFPNPSTGSFFVQFDLPEGKSMKLEAYDMLGRLLSEIQEDRVKNETYEVNLAHLPAGLYLLKINLDGSILTKTISLKR
jgi:hypothetical protein